MPSTRSRSGFRNDGGRKRNARVQCATNLRTIGVALASYASANGGAYPDSLQTLLRHSAELVPGVFVCPGGSAVAAATASSFTGTADQCSYLYVGDGLTVSLTADQILVFDRLQNHQHDVINILFGDGHAEASVIGRPGNLRPWWIDVEQQIANGSRPVKIRLEAP